jgi:PilZ domain
MSTVTSHPNRRYRRIPTPKGVWVAWQQGTNAHQNVSRVRDLNVGGLFIATPEPLAAGTVVQILLSVPEGEIKSEAVVRNVSPRDGMGVEFQHMSLQDSDRMEKLVARLLREASHATT